MSERKGELIIAKNALDFYQSRETEAFDYLSIQFPNESKQYGWASIWDLDVPDFQEKLGFSSDVDAVRQFLNWLKEPEFAIWEYEDSIIIALLKLEEKQISLPELYSEIDVKELIMHIFNEHKLLFKTSKATNDLYPKELSFYSYYIIKIRDAGMKEHSQATIDNNFRELLDSTTKIPELISYTREKHEDWFKDDETMTLSYGQIIHFLCGGKEITKARLLILNQNPKQILLDYIERLEVEKKKQK